MIDIRNLSKTYAERTTVATPALTDVSLRVEQGEFLCIAGPSGSGKSTLLNLIGALDKPTEGRIIFEGKEITDIPITKLADFRLKNIGFIFQSYNLINTLTALENTEYLLLLKGMPAQERKKAATEMLAKVGMADMFDKPVNRLSGGQQQRVAVCRAIVAQPKVILADEPTANLDSKTSEDLIALMHELNREQRMTFIFSSHDHAVINKASRVITLKDGKIVP